MTERMGRRLCLSPRPVDSADVGVPYDPTHRCGRWWEDGHRECTWAGLVFWPRPATYKAPPEVVDKYRRGGVYLGPVGAKETV